MENGIGNVVFVNEESELVSSWWSALVVVLVHRSSWKKKSLEETKGEWSSQVRLQTFAGKGEKAFVGTE